MNITPVIGFAAFSGTGKTTLLEKLIPIFKEQGIRLAVLKHAHHHFDVDKPGKDSYRLRHAGATQMLIASNKRWALMTENDAPENFDTLLSQFDHQHLDLIIVEGFKGENIPKIELHRPSLGHELICADNAGDFIGVATDENVDLPSGITLLDINNPHQIAQFVITHVLD